MDRVEAMSLFLDVIDHGGFSAAAQARGISVATASRRVAELEAAIGTQLLIRTTRKLRLSEAGEAYARAAREILTDLGDAERRASGEFLQPKGELTITAPLEFGRKFLFPIIVGFMELYPDIRVRMETKDLRDDLERVPDNLAVRVGYLPVSPNAKPPLGVLPLAACCSPSLLAQFGQPQTLQDLLRMPQIGIAATPVSRILEMVGVAAGIPDEARGTRLRVESPDHALDAARRGLGVVFMLYHQVASDLAAGNLVQLMADRTPPPLPVYLIHGPRPLPLKTQVFIEYASPRLSKVLASLPTPGGPPGKVQPG